MEEGRGGQDRTGEGRESKILFVRNFGIFMQDG